MISERHRPVVETRVFFKLRYKPGLVRKETFQVQVHVFLFCLLNIAE